jgi:hypothetical protein
MRLLQYSNSELSIHSFDDDAIPPYAILSHTWGKDNEVIFADVTKSIGKDKPGQRRFASVENKHSVTVCSTSGSTPVIGMVWSGLV